VAALAFVGRPPFSMATKAARLVDRASGSMVKRYLVRNLDRLPEAGPIPRVDAPSPRLAAAVASASA
jgi:hypothetical protein